MRKLNAPLRRALADTTTGFARCWQIIRRDGMRFGLTDHDCDISFDDMRFHADAGMRVSAIEQRSGLSSYGLEVDGAIGSPHLEASALADGLYDGAEVFVWLADWSAPENRLMLARGQFGDVEIQDGRFTVALNASTQKLQNPRGRIYQTYCDALLGDKRCGVDIKGSDSGDPDSEGKDYTGFNFSERTVVRLIQETRVVCDSIAPDVGWFIHGELRLDDGRHFAIRDEKIEDDQRIFILWHALPRDFKIGTEVLLVAGCDKRFLTCCSKFSNGLNFQGFPDLPTEDVLISLNPETSGDVSISSAPETSE